MVKKALIILLAVNIISIVQSCCLEDYLYKWRGFVIEIIDNSGEYPKVTTENKVSKKALGFRVLFQDTVIRTAKNFHLVNSCYATSCSPSYTRKDKLSSIKIKALLDYSPQYPSGSDITELFKARETMNVYGSYSSIDQFVSENKVGGDSFDLYLMDNTANSGKQRFEVQLTTLDSIFIQKTDTLTLY